MFKSLFGWVSSLGSLRKKGSTERLSEKGFIPSGAGAATTAKILIAKLAGDKGDQVNKRLAKLLTQMKGVEVFRRNDTLKLSEDIADQGERLVFAAEEGRLWLKDEGADILIWGEADTQTSQLTLRLLPAPGTGGEQAEFSGLGISFEVPLDFDENLDSLFCAAVISTFGPTFKGARTRLGEALGEYLEQAAGIVETLPSGLTKAQAASMLTAIGNSFVAYSHLGGGADQLDRAVAAYREAEKQGSKEAAPLAWARIQNHLAAVLQLQGQKKKDPKPIRAAAVIYSTVGAALDRTAHANDWAMAHVYLGRALYILAGLEGKPDYLRRASTAYEHALSVYDKNSMPGRWAEVTNQYGVVLLALGEEVGADETLEEAVSQFRTAMKVWQRDKSPLLWAQTANNLGAACFALAKRNSEAALLREASSCFEGATEIYREQGVTKQAKVIEKNLHRVQRLLETRGG